jgi:hypothetical protein
MKPMSKLSLVELEDKDLLPNVISAIVDAFKTQTGRFPDALLVTHHQGTDHFIANGEVMSNFRGIPLEVERKTDETATVIKTINGILAGMHINRSKEVADIYQMLENMRTKLTETAK